MNPDLLDEYSLEREDFEVEAFHEIVFASIYNLYQSGISKIDDFAVDQFLSSYPTQYALFNSNKGLEWLNDAIGFCEPENFRYYYHRLKKLSYLRYLDKVGVDTSFLYNPRLTEPDKLEKENAKFDKMSIDEMIDKVESRFVVEAKLKYSSKNAQQGQLAGQGMRELKESFKSTPEFGLSFMDPITTTVARGARLKKFYLYSSNSGGGKAIPNDTVIPTPDGYKKVGEIQVGDYLFSRTGKPTKVLGVYPQSEPKRVYEITFSDGRKARCCDEHLWTYREGKYYKTACLGELLTKINNDKSGFVKDRFKIPTNRPVYYPQKIYTVAPYKIGQRLSRNFAEPIPKEYLTGDIDQRRELLRGILSCFELPIKDGFSFKASQTFTVTFLELSRSLGIVSKCELLDNSIYLITIHTGVCEIGITNIKALDEYANMTCFTVDNEESLFLMNDFIVTHNTRMNMAALCDISIPWSYDTDHNTWVYTGMSEPSLFISTELDFSELQTIIQAHVSGVPEDHIIDGKYGPGEEERVDQAIAYIESAPMYLEFLPDFSITDVENLIKKYKRTYAVSYIVFDYIHTSAKLISEISNSTNGVKIREDQCLFLLSDKMKNLCNTLDVFILSGTQLNEGWKTATEKDSAILRGAKSLADRIDLGVIFLEPSKAELDAIKPILAKKIGMPVPNRISHVYKCRRGKYTKVKLWHYVDLSTCRMTTLFATNSDFKIIPIKATTVVTEEIEQLIEQHSVTAAEIPCTKEEQEEAVKCMFDF